MRYDIIIVRLQLTRIAIKHLHRQWEDLHRQWVDGQLEEKRWRSQVKAK